MRSTNLTKTVGTNGATSNDLKL